MSIEKYLNRILCGDNVRILSSFPDECIDLTVTSPPYDDMGEDFIPIPEKGMRAYNGYSWNFKGLARELYRVTKTGGVVVWVVNDKTIEGSESLASSLQKIYFRRMGFNVETMIYKQDGTGANGDDPGDHPAPFPEDLARDHILSWSNAGDIVLDPFSGSGTTAKKAKELGRPFIGIDISEEYCKLSEKRIAGTNPPLFILEVE